MALLNELQSVQPVDLDVGSIRFQDGMNRLSNQKTDSSRARRMISEIAGDVRQYLQHFAEWRKLTNKF